MNRALDGVFLRWGGLAALGVASHSFSPAQSLPSRDEVKSSLRQATQLMSQRVADHRGYAWVSSVDGRYSHGEGIAGANRVWVQPPGAPAIELAFLAAYRATGEAIHLHAAKAVGNALVQGQLQSGGWGYSIEFDPVLRARLLYRVLLKRSGSSLSGGYTTAPTPYPGGWDVWKKRQFKSNMTLIDDDTTPCAIRFLCDLDRTLGFKEAVVHEAAAYALR